MKVNKALKRLAKIEALMSNVAARYSPSAPRTREVLQDAKAAVARAREAVEAFFRTAKNAAKPKRKRSAAGRKASQEEPQRRAQKRAVAGKAGRAAKKASPARKKAAVKKAAAKAPAAKTPKKRAPIKRAAKKKTAAKPTTPAQYPIAPLGM
jgi:hypothetical protein